MCSSTLSDPANRLRKTRKKKSSAVPLISERSHVGNLRQAIQGKGRSPKRKGNRRCPFLFAPAAGAAVSRAPQSATPSLNLSEKLPARKGRTRLRQFEYPAQPVQKRSRPVRANPLTQFAHPAGSVQKRSRPVRANPLTQFAHPGFPVQKRSRPVRANPLTQFEHPGQPVQKNKAVLRLNCFSDNATAKHRKPVETA